MPKKTKVSFWAIGAVVLLWWVLGGLAAAKEMVVIYPQFASENTRFLDIVELMDTALQKTVNDHGPYKIKQSTFRMNESQYISEAKKGEHVNVIWSSTNPDIEDSLIPIRICLRKGTLGYRIFLINKSDKEKFGAVKTLNDLKKYRMGQGRDWEDVKIYEANGINVVGGSLYDGLFEMLAHKRFDYFPRGINEAFKELEERKSDFPEMMVEESLALYCHWPYYLFVSKTTPEIAERIEAGFNKMIADGSFDAIFMKYNAASLGKANLKNRRIVNINNPVLPPQTPLDRKELWYRP